MGFVYEEVCRQRLNGMNRRNELPFEARDIGPWWDRRDEIDLVARDREGSFLFCECKWTRRKVGRNLLEDLDREAGKIPDVRNRWFGFFSRSGFTKEMEAVAREREDMILLG